MKIIVPLVLIALVTLSLLVIFKQKSDEESESKSKQVSATIFPVYDIVRNIAGDAVETKLILPPGANPHSYDLSPNERQQIESSTAVFAIGHNFDNWATAAAQSTDNTEIITVDKNVILQTAATHEHDGEDEHDQESIDPHYWLTVTNAIGIAAQVKDELSRLYPEDQALFEANYQNYETQLESLEIEIRNELGTLPEPNIATFHNAWGYFAKEYGIDIVITFEEFPGQEPTPVYLQEFQTEIKEHSIKVVFTEPQSSAQSIQAIASDLGVTLLPLDDIGGAPNRNSYTELMRYNVSQIKTGLKL